MATPKLSIPFIYKYNIEDYDLRFSIGLLFSYCYWLLSIQINMQILNANVSW